MRKLRYRNTRQVVSDYRFLVEKMLVEPDFAPKYILFLPCHPGQVWSLRKLTFQAINFGPLEVRPFSGWSFSVDSHIMSFLLPGVLNSRDIPNKLSGS